MLLCSGKVGGIAGEDLGHIGVGKYYHIIISLHVTTITEKEKRKEEEEEGNSGIYRRDSVKQKGGEMEKDI